MLLHRAQIQEVEDLKSHGLFMKRVFEDRLKKIEEPADRKRGIRWELGACWVQHLQTAESGKSENKINEEVKVEQTVKGLGKQLGPLKVNKKKADGVEKSTADAAEQKDQEKVNPQKDVVLQKLLPEALFLRLKESDTGLHLKVRLSSKINALSIRIVHYRMTNFLPTFFVISSVT